MAQKKVVKLAQQKTREIGTGKNSLVNGNQKNLWNWLRKNLWKCYSKNREIRLIKQKRISWNGKKIQEIQVSYLNRIWHSRL